MKIEEIMSSHITTCFDSDTLATAAERMWADDCGILPVIDQSGAMRGVITDRDVCMAAFTKGRALHEIPVSDVMTTELVSLRPTATVADAERMMRDHQVRRIPIVDGRGRPIGVISLNDIVRHAAQLGKKSEDARFVETMAAICEPRRVEHARAAS